MISEVATTYVLVRLWSGGPSCLCLETAWSHCESLHWRKCCRWALCQPCLKEHQSPPLPGGWRSSRALAQGCCSERQFRLCWCGQSAFMVTLLNIFMSGSFKCQWFKCKGMSTTFRMFEFIKHKPDLTGAQNFFTTSSYSTCRNKELLSTKFYLLFSLSLLHCCIQRQIFNRQCLKMSNHLLTRWQAPICANPTTPTPEDVCL